MNDRRALHPRGFRQKFVSHVTAVRKHDPAARGLLEVLLTYPGLHAIWLYRIANALWKLRLPLLPKFIAYLTRAWTGIEIHPAAIIGPYVFIDHGMGVVVGETATIGEGCILFQGVVLGGTSMERVIRHPQLGKNVVVGSHACILGAIEVGDGARIGSGSVVVRPVPPGATVVGIPGRVVPSRSTRAGRFASTLDHASLPDPINEMLRSLSHQNDRLRDRILALEAKLNMISEDDDEPHLVDAELFTNDLPPQHGG